MNQQGGVLQLSQEVVWAQATENGLTDKCFILTILRLIMQACLIGVLSWYNVNIKWFCGGGFILRNSRSCCLENICGIVLGDWKRIYLTITSNPAVLYTFSSYLNFFFFLSSDRKIFLLVFFFFLHDKGLKLLRVYLCVQHGEELGRFFSMDNTTWKSLGCV